MSAEMKGAVREGCDVYVWGEVRQRVGVRGATVEEAVRLFREKFPDARPAEWETESGDDDGDGGLIIGLCEGCERPILEGQPYLAYVDGPIDCANCMPKADPISPNSLSPEP